MAGGLTRDSYGLKIVAKSISATSLFIESETGMIINSAFSLPDCFVININQKSL